MTAKQVSAGIIVHDGKVLIAQRKRGKPQEYLWEFPGGKLEAGETIRECLYRELKEELGVETEIGDFLMSSTYNYDTGSIILQAYWVSVAASEVKCLDAHEQVQWVCLSELKQYNFTSADCPIVEKLLQLNNL